MLTFVSLHHIVAKGQPLEIKVTSFVSDISSFQRDLKSLS